MYLNTSKCIKSIELCTIMYNRYCFNLGKTTVADPEGVPFVIFMCKIDKKIANDDCASPFSEELSLAAQASL